MTLRAPVTRGDPGRAHRKLRFRLQPTRIADEDRARERRRSPTVSSVSSWASVRWRAPGRRQTRSGTPRKSRSIPSGRMCLLRLGSDRRVWNHDSLGENKATWASNPHRLDRCHAPGAAGIPAPAYQVTPTHRPRFFVRRPDEPSLSAGRHRLESRPRRPSRVTRAVSPARSTYRVPSRVAAGAETPPPARAR